MKSCWLKKMHNVRIVVEFIWGKMRTAAWEECIPNSSMKYSSSKEVMGERSIYMIFVKEEFSAIKHLFYKRFSAGHEGIDVPWRRDLVLCRYEEMQRFGIIKWAPENIKLCKFDTEFPWSIECLILHTELCFKACLELGNRGSWDLIFTQARWSGYVIASAVYGW